MQRMFSVEVYDASDEEAPPLQHFDCLAGYCRACERDERLADLDEEEECAA
jgi:hypothetical protein